MAQELYRNKFGTICYDESTGTLELCWLEDSARMTAQDMKVFLEHYAELGVEYETPYMIVDARNFRFQWAPELDSWRNEIIIPQYNTAGVKKFAFLLPQGVAPGNEPGVEPPASYPTGYFDTRDQVDQWLSA